MSKPYNKKGKRFYVFLLCCSVVVAAAGKLYGSSSIFNSQDTGWHALQFTAGVNGVATDPRDPCEMVKPGADSANRLARDSIFSGVRMQLQKAGLDKREHSVTFGRDAAGNFTASPMMDGDTTNGRVSDTWPGAFADMHNHCNSQPPSAGDIYFLIKLNSKYQGYTTRFVVTPGGAVYALHIYDLQLAQAFAAACPMDRPPGFSPTFPEPVFDELDRVSIYFESRGTGRMIAQERALSFILSRYSTGVALLKQDNSGNFKKLHTEEMIHNRARIYMANNCN